MRPSECTCVKAAREAGTLAKLWQVVCEDCGRGRLIGEKPFRVVAADPPWQFGDKLPGGGRGAMKHYDVLDAEDIRCFPLPAMQPDALLFLWRVAALGEEAYSVVRRWGFVPKSEMVWVKTAKGGQGLHYGMGRYVRGAHETCLIAKRGKGRVKDLVADSNLRSVFFEGTKKRTHSAKPPSFYSRVETIAGGGPYLELFSRAHRRGWICLGNEIDQRHEKALATGDTTT